MKSDKVNDFLTVPESAQKSSGRNYAEKTLNIVCSVGSLNPVPKEAKNLPDLSKTQLFSLSKCSSMQEQNFLPLKQRVTNGSIDKISNINSNRRSQDNSRSPSISRSPNKGAPGRYIPIHERV